MKILLINVPTRLQMEYMKFYPCSPPLNFACLLGMIKNDGHEITFLDLYIKEVVIENFKNELPNKEFDLIGLGGIITTFAYVEKSIPILREKYPKAKIMIGGALITSDPELIFDYLKPDIAVFGEGELTFKQLTSIELTDENLANIKGIWYINSQGTIMKNDPQEVIKDLGMLPLPDWSLISLEGYIKNKKRDIGVRTMDALYTRGCPYQCVFCFWKMRPRYRARKVEDLFTEILPLIKKYKIKHIQFLDENFMVNKKKIVDFCNTYKKLNCSFKWDFHTRVDNVDKDLLELVKKHGAVSIGYGIESGSQKMLDAMNKGIKVEQSKEAIRLTRKSGLKVGGTFIFGMIGETKETMWETVDFCNEMELPTRPFFMTPYPGTEVFEMIRDKIPNMHEFLRNLGNANDFLINLTEMSDEELISLRNDAIYEMNDYYWNHLSRSKRYFGRIKLGYTFIKEQGIIRFFKRLFMGREKYQESLKM